MHIILYCTVPSCVLPPPGSAGVPDRALTRACVLSCPVPRPVLSCTVPRPVPARLGRRARPRPRPRLLRTALPARRPRRPAPPLPAPVRPRRRHRGGRRAALHPRVRPPAGRLRRGDERAWRRARRARLHRPPGERALLGERLEQRRGHPPAGVGPRHPSAGGPGRPARLTGTARAAARRGARQRLVDAQLREALARRLLREYTAPDTALSVSAALWQYRWRNMARARTLEKQNLNFFVSLIKVVL